MLVPPDAFRDRVVVITGASSGIGKAVALDLAACGAELHLLGRDARRLEETVSGCRERGGRATARSVDFLDDAAFEQCARELHDALPRIDVLVHSAGVVTLGKIEEAPIPDLDLNYRVNLRAPCVLTQALLARIEAAKGQIVFINSGAGLTARAEWGHYAASKHGLKAIADSLRDEVSERGIRVMTVFPGRTATPMQVRVKELEGRPYDSDELIQAADVSAMLCQALALARTADVVELNIRPGA